MKHLLLGLLLASTTVSAGVRPIYDPEQTTGNPELGRCGDYVYLTDKRQPYDVCMISMLLKTTEKGMCPNKELYDKFDNRCSSRNSDGSKTQGYYVENNQANPSSFIKPMIEE